MLEENSSFPLLLGKASNEPPEILMLSTLHGLLILTFNLILQPPSPTTCHCPQLIL